MVRRVGQNSLYLRDRQPEILRDVGFINAGFPIFNDVIGRHTGTLQHGATALHAGLYFHERTI